MPTLPVGLGETFADKYRLDRVIGEGGMGIVVLAHHLELDQPVAIKFLLDSMAQSPEGAERFRREARAAARIQSDHVARVYDVGVLENGNRYMVMEYLRGRDLAREVSNQGGLPIAYATRLMLEALEAIAEAHAAGIIHRDLKPANIYLAERSDGRVRVKVLDFGISKSIGTSSSAELSLTTTSAWIGSPLYMAPEQMQSARSVDHRADIWSMGAIFYEILAGVPPFLAESLPQLCTLLLTVDAAPVSQKRPEVPVELESIVMRCLSRDPALRYQHATEVLDALQAFASTISGSNQGALSQPARLSFHGNDTLPIEALSQSGPTGSTPEHKISTGTAVAWTEPRNSSLSGSSAEGAPPSRRGVGWGLGLGVLLLASIAVVFWILRPGEDASADALAPDSMHAAEAPKVDLPPPEPTAAPPVPSPAESEPAAAVDEPEAEEPAPVETGAKTNSQRSARRPVAAAVAPERPVEAPQAASAAPQPGAAPAEEAPKKPKARAVDDLNQFGGRR